MSSWSQALDHLVRERGPALYGYAFVLTGDKHAAEDLVQDALIRTFRRGRSQGSLDSTHAYVKRAITTGFIDGHRRSSARPQRAPGEAGDITSPTHPATASAQHTTDPTSDITQAIDIHRALLTLPPRERACIVLRYLEDRPIASVAAELGLATGTVKRYLSDAVATLRATYSDLDMPDPTDTPPSRIPVTPHRGGRS